MPLPHRIYLCSPLALFSLRPTFTSAISKQEASHSLVLRLAHSTITYSHTDATEHNGLSANTEHFVIVLSRTVLHEFFRWAFFSSSLSPHCDALCLRWKQLSQAHLIAANVHITVLQSSGLKDKYLRPIRKQCDATMRLLPSRAPLVGYGD